MRNGLAILAAVLSAASAHASVVRFDITGTVGSVADPNGLYPGVQTGDPFRIDYLLDSSRGRLSGGGGGTGGGVEYRGGTSFVGSPEAQAFPGVVNSPVSSVLTLDGIRRRFPGAFYGDAIETYLVIVASQSKLALTTQDQNAAANDELQATFTSNMTSTFLTALFPQSAPENFHVDGQNITGTVTLTDLPAGATSPTTATLNPSILSIAYVSEPETALLFIPAALLAASRASRQRSRERR